MKAFALLVLLVGCVSGPVGSPDAALDSSTDAAPPSYPIANIDVLAYQDCGGATKDGYRCITTCGRLPDDGGADTSDARVHRADRDLDAGHGAVRGVVRGVSMKSWNYDLGDGDVLTLTSERGDLNYCPIDQTACEDSDVREKTCARGHKWLETPNPTS